MNDPIKHVFDWLEETTPTPITDSSEKSLFQHAATCPPPLYMTVESSIVKNLEKALINSDRLRTTYQLQLEALTLASNRVATHCRYGNHQKIFQTLVELLHDQNEANKL